MHPRDFTPAFVAARKSPRRPEDTDAGIAAVGGKSDLPVEDQAAVGGYVRSNDGIDRDIGGLELGLERGVRGNRRLQLGDSGLVIGDGLGKGIDIGIRHRVDADHLDRRVVLEVGDGIYLGLGRREGGKNAIDVDGARGRTRAFGGPGTPMEAAPSVEAAPPVLASAPTPTSAPTLAPLPPTLAPAPALRPMLAAEAAAGNDTTSAAAAAVIISFFIIMSFPSGI
jgi:hypothetical protein